MILVAVDGGVSTGKTSVCSFVADSLGFVYFNAGLIFRALTKVCLTTAVDLSSAEEVGSAWDSAAISVGFRRRRTLICADGLDVTSDLRSDAIDHSVSLLAQHPEVRANVTQFQRQVITNARKVHDGLVIDGRDARSAVAPEADFKFLLTLAETSPRLTNSPTNMLRNARDASVVDFVAAGPDCEVIDTTHLKIEEVAGIIISRIQAPRSE